MFFFDVFLIDHLIFKDKTSKIQNINKTSIQFATPTFDCSLVALNVMIEITFQRFPAGSVESCHGGFPSGTAHCGVTNTSSELGWDSVLRGVWKGRLRNVSFANRFDFEKTRCFIC